MPSFKSRDSQAFLRLARKGQAAPMTVLRLPGSG